MIRIKHINELQKFAITLTELQTLTSPVFLFFFIHEMTGEERAVILSDSSAYPKRYNLFEVNGTDFTLPGWYAYEVYEQESDTNVDRSQAIGLLEKGRLFVDSLIETDFKENIDNSIHKEYVG